MKIIFSVLFWGLLIFSGSAVPIKLADCDFSKTPVAGAVKTGNITFTQHTADKQMFFQCEPHQNKKVYGNLNIPLKRVRGIALLVAECDVLIGKTTANGSGQVSGKLLVDIYSARGKESAGFTLSGNRYYRERKIHYRSNAQAVNVPFRFPLSVTMKLQITVDLHNSTWCGDIFEGSRQIFTTGKQKLGKSFTPSAMRISVAANNGNDGMLITVSQPSVLAYNAADAAQYQTQQKQLRQAAEYCSTLPRQYKNVNRKFYNAAICHFPGNNNTDRVGAADPATAEKRAKELADLGFNAIICNGRHYRSCYIEEFPHIEEAARIIREACEKYNISVIEHHDPTIMSYRGYPFMLNKLDWLQRDIRSGESNFWFCPGNDNFMSYLMGYLSRFQQKAQVDGFMIDELNLASRRDCGCKECRAAYYKETAKKPPRVLDFKNPGLQQRLFRSWGISMTNNCNNIILNELQKIKSDTVIVTYCSKYFDPTSQTIDLDEAAARYSPFVGWENMLYNPIETHTSMIGNLKTRNAYGDFYNIPIWSLNREAFTPEAFYAMWAMCQATRHAIWYGARVLLTPAHEQYLKKYNKWQGIMPHEFARTFTDTALLVSAQTWRTSAEKNFFWTDFRGVMDTFVRSNRQFDTILDGDIFYPNRLGKYKVLVLASQSSLSETQCRTLEKFVKNGGVIILTGNSSLYDEYGNSLPDFRLAKAMNLRFTNRNLAQGKVTSSIPGTAKEFVVPHVLGITLIDPDKSKVLAEYNNGKEHTPLAVETAYGKGAFIYLAAQYGKYLYEQEIRHNVPYNYKPHAKLSLLLNSIYDYAHKRANAVDPVTVKFPEKVLAVVNQQQGGKSAGDIFVQIMNFTGSKVAYGKKMGAGTPETVDFPPIKEDLTISINRPCSAEAILESPERPSVTVKGVKQGNSTVFSIPGSKVGFFAQLKIQAPADKNMRIIEPPMSQTITQRKITSSPLPDLEKLYHPAELRGKISDQLPPQLSQGNGFTIGSDGKIKLNGKEIIAGDEFRQSHHEWMDFTSIEKFNTAVCKGWQDPDSAACGTLVSGKSSQGKAAFVKETTRLTPDKVEINFAGSVKITDHGVLNNSYTLKIPVDILRGATGYYFPGMHRSARPPRRKKLTGNEPDGKVIDSIRNIQFTGGVVDFSIDFATMGVWGLYVEDLSSQYKAHLIKEGNYYILVIPSNDSRFGTKYCMKVVIRSGKTDFSKIHTQNFNQYQHGRPVSKRLQFTDGKTAKNFALDKKLKGINLEFSRADMQLWNDPAAVKLIRCGNMTTDPLHYSAACGKGKNSYTFEHENGLALVNVMLSAQAETIKGSIRANQGKAISFNVNKGNFHTVLLPVMIKNNKVTLEFDGNWAISGIVMQPLMTPDEDYLFSRTYFNCGKVPWLLKELQCDPADWKYFSDIHLRKARWMY